MASDTPLIERLLCSPAPGLDQAEKLLAHLRSIVQDHFGADPNVSLANSLAEKICLDRPFDFDPGSLSQVDAAYAKSIASFSSGNASFKSASFIGAEYDFLPRSSADWPLLKVINFRLLQAIRADRDVAIVTSIRNEGLGLLEWIAHHRALGVDGFFVYTNNSTDGSNLLLHRLAEHGVIRLIENRVAKDVAPQLKGFEHAIHFLPELRRYRWAFFLDADEFFVPKAGFSKGNGFAGLFEVLAEEFGDELPGAVAFNWKWFGSENAYQQTDGLVTTRFEHCLENPHVKSLVRLAKVFSLRAVHSPTLCPGSFAVNSALHRLPALAVQTEPAYENGQINHYWNKSFEEFVIKKFRGRGAVSSQAGQRDFSTFFEWGNNAVLGSHEPPQEAMISATRLEMNTLSSLPGIGEAMDIIKRTFRRTLHRIDQQYDLKAVYKLKGKLDSIKPKLLDCRVEFARRFLEGSGDMVSFSHLAPVSVLSEWSAVALVRPTEVQSYAGVICQRSEFAVGKNLFTFWLKDGAISIEADARGKTSSLAPPLNQWSLIGATAASDGSAVYLGVNGKVETEDLPGLTTGSAGDDLPIAIGQLGSNFPGSIAFVALYSEKLSDPVMREICSGKLHAFRAPGIVFAWAPNEKIDTDRISDSAGSVSGTTLIDCDHD